MADASGGNDVELRPAKERDQSTFVSVVSGEGSGSRRPVVRS
jgi:hypothetical protein